MPRVSMRGVAADVAVKRGKSRASHSKGSSLSRDSAANGYVGDVAGGNRKMQCSDGNWRREEGDTYEAR